MALKNFSVKNTRNIVLKILVLKKFLKNVLKKFLKNVLKIFMLKIEKKNGGKKIVLKTEQSVKNFSIKNNPPIKFVQKSPPF